MLPGLELKSPQMNRWHGKEHEEEVMRTAMASETVRDALRGDLHLYHNVLLPLFRGGMTH